MSISDERRSPATGSPLARVRDLATRLRRAVLRRRRPLAALLAAGAVGAGVHAIAPPPPATVTVLVATRDLPAGASLAADDLHPSAVEERDVPDGAVTDPDRATDAVLASPLRRGEPLTDVRLVGAGLVAAAPATVATPLRLSDAAQAALLTVGDVVDLLATDPEARTTETIAHDVVVLALPAPDPTTSDALTGRLVVIGIPVGSVTEVTAAGVTAFVTYAWASR
ncbi:SAF domain-containing protein [Nocardioides stalactiti]|uniref:SAF domain-containing protein n=1 Tax=Nocardioides stalactiti TaxID=2755356 RepID=UPI0015FF731D|nr:SAF domain-containing protein [Nocardioides stalactiti]